MSLSIKQIMAIARYELLLQWRRRTLLVIILSFVAMLTVFTAILPADNVGWVQENMTPAQVTAVILFGFAPIAISIIILTIPSAMAEAIPKDQQWHMAELFGSLPVSTGSYLSGKLLGVWLTVALVLSGATLFQAILGWLFIGRPDLLALAKFSLLATIPAGLVLATWAALLASRQPNRRRATLIGAAITGVGLFMLPTNIMQQERGWAQAFDFGAWFTSAMFQLNKQMQTAGMVNEVLTQYWNANDAFIAQTLVAGAGQIALLFVATWGWWRWRPEI